MGSDKVESFVILKSMEEQRQQLHDLVHELEQVCDRILGASTSLDTGDALDAPEPAFLPTLDHATKRQLRLVSQARRLAHCLLNAFPAIETQPEAGWRGLAGLAQTRVNAERGW